MLLVWYGHSHTRPNIYLSTTLSKNCNFSWTYKAVAWAQENTCLFCIQFLQHLCSKLFTFLRQLKSLSCCEGLNCTFLIIYCILVMLIIRVNYKHHWLMCNLNEDTPFRSSHWMSKTMKLLLITYWAGIGEGFTIFPPISFWRPKLSLHCSYLIQAINYIITGWTVTKVQLILWLKPLFLLLHIPDILAILGEHKIETSYSTRIYLITQVIKRSSQEE